MYMQHIIMCNHDPITLMYMVAISTRVKYLLENVDCTQLHHQADQNSSFSWLPAITTVFLSWLEFCKIQSLSAYSSAYHDLYSQRHYKIEPWRYSSGNRPSTSENNAVVGTCCNKMSFFCHPEVTCLIM